MKKDKYYDPIIDEKVVVDINTPEGKKFYEDMEGENYILFSGGRAKGKTYTLKKLQAFEIIKEKNVDVWSLKNSLPELTYEKYLQVNRIPQFAFSEQDLTKEEFNLLRGVLVND